MKQSRVVMLTIGLGFVCVLGQACNSTDPATVVTVAAEDNVVPAPLADDAPGIEDRARRVLQAAGDYLKKARTFSFHAEITHEEVLPSGRKIQYSASNKVMVRRPDRIRADYYGDLRKSSFWYDGKTVTLLHTDNNLYATFKAPNRIDDAVDFAVEKYGLSVPMADLVYSDPYSILMERVKSGFYEGLHMVNGIKCHHLSFTQDNVDWQIWIEDGPQAVPRKVVIDYKNMDGCPHYSAILSDWDFTVRLPDLLFTFEAPSGSEQIEFLEEAPDTDDDSGRGEEE